MKIILFLFSIILISCSQGGGSSSSNSKPDNNIVSESIRDLIIENNSVYSLNLNDLGNNFSITTLPNLGNLTIQNNILTYCATNRSFY